MINASSTRMLETRHAFVSVEGMRLHWAELGNTCQRAPVVLLHGLNDSYLTWKRVAPALALDRRVLLPDLPGYGLSDRPDASYELGWHAHVMAKWLETIGLESVDLVGQGRSRRDHSRGAWSGIHGVDGRGRAQAIPGLWALPPQ